MWEILDFNLGSFGDFTLLIFFFVEFLKEGGYRNFFI